ncbi:hypothetical protein CLV25_101275 [Acetobacteroides hydrogenigenes]|uniref:Uncharacterized protein n=1 Tax=Acetobacteroides hydrogenigenes TaxID=979970 RepID=A0A4R2EYN9_9BACT|nr:hypothetical protein CLV25_101275 [Acetobacteroides hydrogenigenes]
MIAKRSKGLRLLAKENVLEGRKGGYFTSNLLY